MVETKSEIQIDENELEISFVRSDGPGGQNVNKVATAVQIRFNVWQSESLPEEVKVRLVKIAGKRMTQDGILVIEARRYRTQERNRKDGIARMNLLVQKALQIPKVRKQTKPSATSINKRLVAKKQHGEIKRSRQKYLPDD